MKPRQKVVTAQDVQSSLYYLHLASPNDYELLRNQDSTKELEEELLESNSVLRTNIPPQRKVLPQDALAQARTDTSVGRTPPARKPIGEGRRLGHKSHGSAPKVLPCTLIGPRLMNPRLHLVDSSALHNVPQRQNIAVRRWPEQPPMKPPQSPLRPNPIDDDTNVPLYLKEGKGAFDSMNEQEKLKNTAIRAKHCWEWERSWESKCAIEARLEMDAVVSAVRTSQEMLQHISSLSQDTSLSLIRRYNGEQWNVAQIELTGQEQLLDVKNRISLEISTPGYSKFVKEHTLGEASLSTEFSKESMRVEDEGKAAYRLQMQVLKGTSSPQKPHFPESTEGPRPSSEGLQPNSTIPRASSSDPSIFKSASSAGYAIQTPWDGICEFTTGIAGRSLKCKHSYVPLKPTYGSGAFSAAVSELRFNLPSSKAFGNPPSKSSYRNSSREGKRSSVFLQPHHRRTPSSLETRAMSSSGDSRAKIRLEERLDLSLGQEHAGGGFGGKQAKLGKLIVQPEGLQMLDLVVAANMALWWKVYENIA